MLPNEKFALECRAYYDSIGLTVDERNGEFAHCPYPKGMGETGYYLLHDHHQQQGIIQSKDVNQCCFFTGYAKNWLETCEAFPDNYFELWCIYEEYASLHAKEAAKKTHEMKNEEGKSLQAVKNAEHSNKKKTETGKSVNSVKAGKASTRQKREDGKSINAVKAAEAAHSPRDGQGRSLLGIENSKRLHRETNEEGKSTAAVKGAQRVNSQKWQCLVTGYISTPGPLTVYQVKRGIDPSLRLKVH